MLVTAVANDALPGTLKPDEIVVVANASSKDSLRVARHYMQRRKIPEAHLFTFAYADHSKLEPMDQNPAWYPYPVFRRDVVKPLEAFLEERQLKERVLCLVTVYGTPYRIGRFEFTPAQEKALRAEVAAAAKKKGLDAEQTKKLLKKTRHRLWYSNKAFDSELAWLFGKPRTGKDDSPLAGMRARLPWQQNEFYNADLDFGAFRKKQLAGKSKGLLYMVARLDGETPVIAMGLVDKALAAEKGGGLKGAFCLDARNKGPNRKGYNQGDWWIRRAHESLTRAGMKGVYDTAGKPLAAGTCPAPAIYWGFYHPFDYRGEIFNHKFAVGAIGCEQASFEAARLWRGKVGKGKGGPWVPGMLKDGVTVAIGPVSEPYLQAFPETQVFFPKLLSGWCVGQAYWASIKQRSWRLIIIGDPMYRPFPNRGVED